MKVLILEDEEPAALRLKNILQEIEPEAEILDVLVSVNSAIKWLSQHDSPDLILQDINLADGSSFEIFKRTDVQSPVIFITAYDEFAIQAFKVNSVEYLLKPVKKEELESALKKFRKLHLNDSIATDIKSLIEDIADKKKAYKKRFMIRFGERIKTIDIANVAYFYTEEKINFLKTKDNHTYPIDYNLDKLEAIIDPERFFRINRQFIISLDSISEMYSFSKSRVKVILNPSSDLDTIVSTERSPLFKEWLSGIE